MAKRDKARAEPLYRRGPFWLDYDRKEDGSLRSPNLYIWSYDPETQRIRSASTGTSDLELGKLKLDERYEAANGRSRTFCPTCGQPMASTTYLILDA